MGKYNIDYDCFLTEIYDYSQYFGKERKEKDYATPFYLSALKDIDSKILEFVSCTGLLTIPLARAGYKVDSVDISPYMHDKIREKLQNEQSKVSDNVSLHCCNVFDYKSENKYKAIVVPDSFLLAIHNKKKQKQFLKMCYSLLEDKGILAFDVFKPWLDIIEKKESEQCSRFRTEKGELYIVYTHHFICKRKQLHKFEFIHELYKDHSRRYNIITYRYIYMEEIKELLKKCGFKLLYFDDSFNFGKNYAIVAQKDE